jgi:hypothetical protein
MQYNTIQSIDGQLAGLPPALNEIIGRNTIRPMQHNPNRLTESIGPTESIEPIESIESVDSIGLDRLNRLDRWGRLHRLNLWNGLNRLDRLNRLARLIRLYEYLD